MKKAAGLFLVNKNNEILVCHPTNHDPDFWSIPKGKIEKHENALEAAIRETYEESNVKLDIDSNVFTKLGETKYRHGKKKITLFVCFEGDNDQWDQIELKCNSNVSKDKGGFPEMDDFKWVSVKKANEILHYTQIKFLPSLGKLIK